MIRELEIVALTRDIVEHGLKAGDIGTVVHCYKGKRTFEVEFVSAEGETIGLLTLTRDSIRHVTGKEILHVRKFELVAQ